MMPSQTPTSNEASAPQEQQRAKASAVSPRVFIVDDHAIFRQGLAASLKESGDIVVCGEAENASKALETLPAAHPDVVVVDISMPGVNGIELIQRMREESPDVAFVTLSMHDQSSYAIRSLRAGARGYVTKTEPVREILTAIRTVREGDLYISPCMGNRMIFKNIRSVEQGKGSVVDKLTERELEIFRLLGRGFDTNEIAAALNLGRKTVETHRAHIREKLECQAGSDVVLFAIDWVSFECLDGN